MKLSWDMLFDFTKQMRCRFSGAAISRQEVRLKKMQYTKTNMQYAIDMLKKEREQIIAALRQGEGERLQQLQALDQALEWLQLLQKYHIGKACRYELVELPYIEDRGGFNSYRLMIDDETDEPASWIEYKKTDGSPYLLGLGDYLLVAKPKN